MRTVLAALFVYFGISLVMILLGESLNPIHGRNNIAIIFILGCAGVLSGSIFIMLAWIVFQSPPDPLGRLSPDEYLSELERQGLLISTDYEAQRAFGIEEFDDDGPHYFLELTDGRALYLHGQYLDDYEPILDDPEIECPRRFPCTHFSIRQHKTEHYVVEIQCRGPVLEPEFVADTEDANWKRWRWGDPDCGVLVLPDATYERVKKILFSTPPDRT